ncbi:MAG: hypothetical protein MJH10_15885 [Epibacterium sp.]|nr:hypothetical protein [Epibacterium sp.]NQX74997.1 hypothetical protein [Epibacterium sp.]
MDFNQFDTVSAAEKGAPYHIECPVSLRPLFDNPKDPFEDNGKPCLVYVKGQEAASVRAQFRKEQQEKAKEELKDDDGSSSDYINFDELHDKAVRSFAPRIVRFENVKKGKKDATADDAEWFLNLNRVNNNPDEKPFVRQVADFSNSRSGYLGNDLSG